MGSRILETPLRSSHRQRLARRIRGYCRSARSPFGAMVCRSLWARKVVFAKDPCSDFPLHLLRIFWQASGHVSKMPGGLSFATLRRCEEASRRSLTCPHQSWASIDLHPHAQKIALVAASRMFLSASPTRVDDPPPLF